MDGLFVEAVGACKPLFPEEREEKRGGGTEERRGGERREKKEKDLGNAKRKSKRSTKKEKVNQ